MPIQVTTVYTKERLLRFNNFVVRSKGWMWILMAACTLIVGAAYGLLLSLGERDRMVEWGFFFILFSISSVSIMLGTVLKITELFSICRAISSQYFSPVSSCILNTE